MAKSKYEDDFPLIAEGLARQGWSDKQIWTYLGIGKSAFYSYMKKYENFSDSIKRGRKPHVFFLENTALKIATGYETEEEHTEIETNKDGEIVRKKIKKIKKQVNPDRNMIEFLLCNWEPARYRRKDKEDKKDENQTVHIEFTVDKTEKED